MLSEDVSNTAGRLWTYLTTLLLEAGGNAASLKHAVVALDSVAVDGGPGGVRDLENDLLYFFSSVIEHLLNLGVSKEKLTTEFNFNVHTMYDLLHPEAKEAS